MRNLAFQGLCLGSLLCGSCAMVEESSHFCTADLRVAVTGTLLEDSGALVKPQSVTARANGGAPVDCALSPGSYVCTEQGGGRYEVTVTSGGEKTTRAVQVDADECHVTGSQSLDFVLPLDPTSGCADHWPLIAELDLSGVEYLRLRDEHFRALQSSVDGKLRGYAPVGLAAGVEQTLQVVVRTGTQCAVGHDTIATLVFVPQVKDCGYEAVQLILNEESLQYCSASI